MSGAFAEIDIGPLKFKRFKIFIILHFLSWMEKAFYCIQIDEQMHLHTKYFLHL